jgi:hypothetical protein
MTGDVTGVAQSAFARAGSHFGSNKNANAIKRHLAGKEIEPENCKAISQLVFGPIFPYWHSVPRHSEFDQSRAKVAALERKLWVEVARAGHSMLNKQPSGSDIYDEQRWVEVHNAFAPHFKLLTAVNLTGVVK